MIKLVIFDVDGVILDSETLFIESCKEVCKKYNYDIPLEALLSTIGRKYADDKEIITPYLGSEELYDFFGERVGELRKEKVDKGVTIKKGFFELINYLKKENIMITFATSTAKDVQEPILTNNKILDLFVNPTYGTDVKIGKPSPEIYLKALSKFDVSKEETLIIEDSNNGILSAINAGIKVIYCPDLAIVSEENLAKTYDRINNLTEAIGIIERINKV